MKIFLIGYRCTGKTTTGRILADLLGFDFIDTDRAVEKERKISISQIVKNCGLEDFRKTETSILLGTLDRNDLVVATGGGIVLAPENREFIKRNGICIWLAASPWTIIKRLKKDLKNESRPSLTGRGLVKETFGLLCRREALYSETAVIKILTGSHSPERIAEKIKRKIF